MDDLQRTLTVNVTGIFNVMQATLGGMVERGWGRVVNVASIAGKEGNPNLSAYSASKGAVIALTKSVAKELATTGVLVNSIAPAVIATPMNLATRARGARLHAREDPDGPPGPALRGGRPGGLAVLGGLLVQHRRLLRHLRRQGHLLMAERFLVAGACCDLSGVRATF